MCMMYKNSLLLSIATTLLWSLFLSDLAHAVQTESSSQDNSRLMVAELNRTATVPTAQLSSTANPCHVSGKGRTRAACGMYSQPAPGARTADWSPYTNAIFTVMLTVILSALTVLTALSLALIALAALSRRTPHLPLERASINLAFCGQGERAP
jgi:hypothetical protein